MKSKSILLTLLSILLLCFFATPTLAQSTPDFSINTYTKIFYTTGQDYVTIVNEYERIVENNLYFFTKEGEKTFHIPDVSKKENEVTTERAYKKNSLKVTDNKENPVNFKIEELPTGEGMYLHIPFYRTTTKTLPYKIKVTYDTHDNVVKSGNLVILIASSLPEDTVFQRNDQKNNTSTRFLYNLSIIVDKNIPVLAKAYPNFVKEEKDNLSYYNFSSEDRIKKSPILEFGTSVVYKFELEYKTPKTDNMIPEKYSKFLKALSTNIFELSLPREFSETNQAVVIEEITPLPENIYRDEEGNVIASFEIPANKEDIIKISGYISSAQEPYSPSTTNPLDIDFDEYLKKVQSNNENNKYLAQTKYWEVKNPLIQKLALDLKGTRSTLSEVIDSVYQYINDTLTYDDAKASSYSLNERIGAVNALTGGASVCMEYADSMIAILRAQGIPARAAFGYANITDTPQELIRHQWVQVWIPDAGWISIDPTFESSNRKIGQLIERVLWETFNDDSLSNVYIYSINDLEEITNENFSIKIFAVDEIPDIEKKTYSDILPNNDIENSTKYTMGNWSNTFLKTTVLGRAILVTLPITVTLIFTIFFLIILKAIKKKASPKKQEEPSIVNKPVGRFPI